MHALQLWPPLVLMVVCLPQDPPYISASRAYVCVGFGDSQNGV